MNRLLLATANKGKVIEMREGLEGLGLEFLTLRDVNIDSSPEETGLTYEENAKLKARYYFDATGIPSLADDSGILVEALGNELGIHTRRWGAGPAASDEEWIAYFLERMKKEENRQAEFVCVLALACFDSAQHDTTVRVFEGRCHGAITEDLQAEYLPGLPISACFIPDGCDRVFSALPIDLKNRVSHRGEAVGKVRGFLQGHP